MSKCNLNELQEKCLIKNYKEFILSSVNQINNPSCISYSNTYTVVEYMLEDNVMRFSNDTGYLALSDIVSVSIGKEESWGLEVVVECRNYQDLTHNNTYTFLVQ